jgi:hypothetical protein
VYCFLITCTISLYVLVWSVVNDQFMEYAAIEDQEGFEQQHTRVEGKSLLHSPYPITTCILITVLFTFSCINVMGPMLRCD